jgi:hypothetical protein
VPYAIESYGLYPNTSTRYFVQRGHRIHSRVALADLHANNAWCRAPACRQDPSIPKKSTEVFLDSTNFRLVLWTWKQDKGSQNMPQCILKKVNDRQNMPQCIRIRLPFVWGRCNNYILSETKREIREPSSLPVS